jgi:hypothetical protein
MFEGTIPAFHWKELQTQSRYSNPVPREYETGQPITQVGSIYFFKEPEANHH